MPALQEEVNRAKRAASGHMQGKRDAELEKAAAERREKKTAALNKWLTSRFLAKEEELRQARSAKAAAREEVEAVRAELAQSKAEERRAKRRANEAEWRGYRAAKAARKSR